MVKHFQVYHNNSNNKVILKCKNCNSYLKVDQKFCGECGAAFSEDNVIVEMPSTTNESYVNTFSNINNLNNNSINNSNSQMTNNNTNNRVTIPVKFILSIVLFIV